MRLTGLMWDWKNDWKKTAHGASSGLGFSDNCLILHHVFDCIFLLFKCATYKCFKIAKLLVLYMNKYILVHW